MPLGDTIAALATPLGNSARAILRISGPATGTLLRVVLSETSPPRDPGQPAAAPARFTISEAISLPVLIIRAFAPRSYTGEDTAEILFPGNPHLAERLLARVLCIDAVRLASPGEFTARAYLNDKLTLDQAEGVAATIAAENDEQLNAARSLLAGTTGDEYRRWLEEIATLLALTEAGIDFTDQEDVVAIQPRELCDRLTRLSNHIESHLGAVIGAEASRALPQIVLAGRPNAGKSTLFNALLGRRRAVVSPEAGTTRDVLEETLDLSRDLPGGGPVSLIDLAGLDEALAVPGLLDQQAQQQARDALAAADVIIHCDPHARYDLPLPAGRPIIRVRTKADLPVLPVPRSPDEAGLAETTPSASGHIAICALDGWNLAVLRRAIADASTGSRGAGVASLLPRHRRELTSAREAIHEALRSIDPGSPHIQAPEVVAGSLRAALDSLGELAGRVSPDDVIGRIFATFCIGK